MSDPRAKKCDVDITVQCPHCDEWDVVDDDHDAFNGDHSDSMTCSNCYKDFSYGGMAATANHSSA